MASFTFIQIKIFCNNKPLFLFKIKVFIQITKRHAVDILFPQLLVSNNNIVPHDATKGSKDNDYPTSSPKCILICPFLLVKSHL